MDELSRRDSLKVIAAGNCRYCIRRRLTGGNVEAQDKSSAQAFRGQHQPKPLGFDPSKGERGYRRSSFGRIGRTTTAER